MAQYKLTYFDFPGGRGEDCRLAFFVAGVPFEDERLSGEQFVKAKASLPFGALPVLTVEGKGQLGQSNAILRFIGSQYGLLPTDPFEAARHEAVLGAVEDLRAEKSFVDEVQDPEEKKRARQEFASGFMQEWGACIERQIGDGPFLAGAKLSVADLKLFVVTGPFLRGAIDHIPSDVFKAFPKLLRLVDAVKKHPKVAEWYAR